MKLYITLHNRTSVRDILTLFKSFPLNGFYHKGGSRKSNKISIGEGGMSRISGLRNDMDKRTFYKERKINERCIHFLSKQNIKAPRILQRHLWDFSIIFFIFFS